MRAGTTFEAFMCCLQPCQTLQRPHRCTTSLNAAPRNAAPRYAALHDTMHGAGQHQRGLPLHCCTCAVHVACSALLPP
jgi:hypothetical protein